jgi:hypothetical protein
MIKKSKVIIKGLIFGIIPHTFCILFIIFAALGSVLGTTILKKFLTIPYFFHFLILLSFIFSTVSIYLYLKRKGQLGKNGIINNWKYVSLMYLVVVSVNFIFFFVIFPSIANIQKVQKVANNLSHLTLKVDIPCTGHAPLIKDEINSLGGIVNINFSSPNVFKVQFDSSKTSTSKILSLVIFKTYKAKVLN